MRFRLAYVGIQVRDLARSLSFYQDSLGMQIVRRGSSRNRGRMGRTSESRFRLDPGTELYPEGSAFFHGPYRNGDELDHIAFECEDVERAYRGLLGRGAAAGHAPFVEGGTLLAFVKDPDGIWIELTGPDERR